MQREGKREIKKWFLLAISYQPQSLFLLGSLSRMTND